MSKPPISAFIICCNEEEHIRRCLESVSWCAEIIVVDSGSTDNTLNICKEYTDKIYHKEWKGFVEQKRFALEQCTQEWVFNIDADEEVSPELRRELTELTTSTQPQANGFYLLRTVFFQNKWWRKGGWYPEYRLRFSKRNCTQWGGEDPHERAIVHGETNYLKSELYHYTYENFAGQIDSLNSLSTTAAKNMYKNHIHSNPIKIFINPLLRFFKFFIIKKGFLEGYAGLLVAVLEGFYVFLKYTKLWELERENKQK